MRFTSRVLIGLLVLVFGIALLADNLNIFEFDMDLVFETLFAVFVIGIGLRVAFGRNGIITIIIGAAISLVGINMLNESYNFYDFDTSLVWGVLWPTVIILFALKLIFNFKGKSKIAIFSGVNLGDRNWKVEDNSYSAIMGGFDLNLCEADIKEGETKINLSAIMGGIDVIVPDNINVICEGKVIMGGIEFLGKSSGGLISSLKKEYTVNSSKTLILECDVLMGGIEIKARQPFNV